MEGGFVSIVGAGPGSIEHMTKKAFLRLRQADVVLYDALIQPEIVKSVRTGAMRIFCGKRQGQHAMSQAQIQQVMIRWARRGYRVVRLKGGDPLVFGRGGEEAMALRRANVGFEIIPGVSAMNAIGALVGIPMTHRGVAKGVLVIEGHSIVKNSSDDSPEGLSDWKLYANWRGTIVIYMGITNARKICQNLITAGAPRTRSFAVVESGDEPADTITVSTLGEIADVGFVRKTTGPGILYIGDVVDLRPEICPPIYHNAKGGRDGAKAAHIR